MRCPHCDAELPDDALFCSECGSRVTSTPAHLKVEETLISASPIPVRRQMPVEEPDGLTVQDDDEFDPGTLETPTPVMLDPNSPQYEDEEDRVYDAERRPWGVYIGLFLLIAALVAGVVWVTYDAEIWGGHTLPDVVGMERAQAVDALVEFNVSITEEARDDSIGLVLSMSPAAGHRVEPGSEVRLRVGIARIIPEVIGLTGDEARQALLDAGARDITISYVTSSQPEGTVIGCEPAPGSEFVSTDKVTLTIAQALTVPNVVGKTTDEASAILSAAGLSTSIEYVVSDRTQGTVVATVPAGGTVVEEGSSVVLQVPSPDPTDRYHLVEYYDMTPQQVADYVGRLGFSLDAGWSSDAGAFAHYTLHDTGEVLYFTHDPETGHYDPSSGTDDVLGQGVSFVGVRYQFPTGTTNQISTDGVHEVMAICGFENLVDFCTEETIVAPAEAPVTQSNFICAYGEQGRYVWAVLIGGYGLTNDTVVLVMPKTQFEQGDLSNFGGGICDYIAYANYFTG